MSAIVPRDAEELDDATARLAELLAPFSPVDRVRPRRLDDAELLGFAGCARGALYRLVESGALVPERAPAPPRKDGRRGTSRCFLTLAEIARWRIGRLIPVNEGPAAPGPRRQK